jgi:hypothetical protein
MSRIDFLGFPFEVVPGTVRSSERREIAMMQLEQSLSKLLDEHQQEDGLHMIGGRLKLIHRLVEFFEAEQKQDPVEVGQRGN